MEQKRISMDELSQKLVASRKIMSKVDNGDFEKGAISENMIESIPEEQLVAAPEMAAQGGTPNKSLHKAPRPITEDKVNQSKLPDNIKKAMLENPIPQIGLDSTLDMDFVEKTRKLMEADGTKVPRRKVNEGQQTRPATQTAQTPAPKKSTATINDLERRLTPIIENIIRKTLDEIVDRKLTQILSAAQGQTINENLAIKVGETIFTGKLTKAKSSK